jgi:hypothetical protein
MSSIPNTTNAFDEVPEEGNLSRASTLCSINDANQYRNGSDSSFHISFLNKFSPAKAFQEVDLEKKIQTEDRQPESRYRKLSDLLVNWWAWELFCWLVSALCMFAISVLLGLYDDKRLPKRWPLGITLNAYISVLSAVVKLALAVSLHPSGSDEHMY